MRALVVGAGSVGGYFGSRLAAAKRDVSFLVRPQRAYQLERAIADFAPHVSERTMILPVLNGMQHMDQLRGRFGAARVIGGVARIATSLARAGADRGSGELP